MSIYNRKKGFTIMEVMVVVSIISVLTAIILFSVSEARKNGRDKKRISDLANIEFALALYKEDSDHRGKYPNIDGGAVGTVDGGASAFDTAIEDYLDGTFTDPSGGSYGYWYDSDFRCTTDDQIVLVAKAMEKAGNANAGTICTASNSNVTSSGPVTNNSYLIILD